MPLPDERPRPSVANLIGRFELQKKQVPADSPKPIQLPGRSVSGIQERRTNLGPDLANNLLRNSQALPTATSPPEKADDNAATSGAVEAKDEQVTEPEPPAIASPPAPEPPVVEAVAEPEPLQQPEEESEPAPAAAAAAPSVSRNGTVRKATAPPKPTSPPSSTRPLKPVKARSPPPATSVAMAKSSSATQKSNAARAESQPARSQNAGNSAMRGAASPVPHYMTPLRPQNTGSQTDTKVRSKTPVTKPRTVASTTPASSSSHLMAPTASSLAKARTAVSTPAKTNTKPSTSTAPAKKVPSASGAKPDAQGLPQPSTTRARTISSTVPFPSVRKPKSSAPPSTVSKSKTTSAASSTARQSRISQSSSKGPSAAALAALAKVNAPPVPSIPAQEDVIVAAATIPAADGAAIPAKAGSNGKLASSVALPSAASESGSTMPISFPSADSMTSTVVEPVGDGSGNVLVVDAADGVVEALPARPLTEAALEDLDAHTEGSNVVVPSDANAEADGATSVVAVHDGETALAAGSSNGVLQEPDAVPISPTSPVAGSAHPLPESSADPIVSPVAGQSDGDELKDDAHPEDGEHAAPHHEDIPDEIDE